MNCPNPASSWDMKIHDFDPYLEHLRAWVEASTGYL